MLSCTFTQGFAVFLFQELALCTMMKFTEAEGLNPLRKMPADAATFPLAMFEVCMDIAINYAHVQSNTCKETAKNIGEWGPWAGPDRDRKPMRNIDSHTNRFQCKKKQSLRNASQTTGIFLK